MTVDEILLFFEEVSQDGFGKEEVKFCNGELCKCKKQLSFKYNDINGTSSIIICAKAK